MSDILHYHFVGESKDGLLIFKDLDYPTDAPQPWVRDEDLRRCSSTDPLLYGPYFCVTRRHAEVRGFLWLVLEATATQDHERRSTER
jgi:hypothetical protein